MLAVSRGCGQRIAGGAYVIVRPDPHGRPIRDFLLDPPIPVPDPAALGISPVGVTLGTLGEGTTPVVYDWVGAVHYPNVADFIGEAGRFGLSRRIPRTFDFRHLTPGTRLAVLHPRAILVADVLPTYWREHLRHPLPWDGERVLPAGCQKHPTPEQPMCVRLWWDDVEGGADILDLDPTFPSRSVERALPSFSYRARRPPDGVPCSGDRHRLGIFALFPIHGIDVIRDPLGSHDRTVEAALRSGLPVSLEDA